jgi:hypothetical protein
MGTHRFAVLCLCCAAVVFGSWIEGTDVKSIAQYPDQTSLAVFDDVWQVMLLVCASAGLCRMP